MSSASSGGDKGQHWMEEFPTIREQDLAIIVGDWIHLKSKQPQPSCPGEIDPLDLTMIVAELSRGLHPRSLRVIHDSVPRTERWEHLRTRLEQLIVQKIDLDDEYGGREIPVH